MHIAHGSSMKLGCLKPSSHEGSAGDYRGYIRGILENILRFGIFLFLPPPFWTGTPKSTVAATRDNHALRTQGICNKIFPKPYTLDPNLL